MNRNLRGAALVLLGGALLGGPAAGGAGSASDRGVIISATSQDTVKGSKRTQRTILSGRMLRTEDGGKTSIVSIDQGSIWETSSAGTCVRYSAADLAGLAQSAEVERHRMLEAAGATASAPLQISYRKLASGEPVGKWKGDRFAKESNGLRMLEVTVVPLSALKLTRADLAGLGGAREVFGAAPSTWDQETLSLLEHAATVGYDAFPVRIAVFDGSGRARFVSELTGVTFRRIPPKAFQPPERCTQAAPLLPR